MKSIKKQQEPQSLTFHKKQSFARYNNYDQKNELRQSLLAEQGYICCYCMKRITEDKMRIEHWLPQSKHPDRELDYANLLAACQGGENGSKRQYHCDVSKGEQEIFVHPNEAIGTNCEALVQFRRNGYVYSKNEDIDRELNQILKLNLQHLVEGRVAALDGFQNALAKKYKSSLNRQKWQELYEDLSCGKDGQYKEYCRVVLAYIEKKLN